MITKDMKIDKKRELLEFVAKKMFFLNAFIAVVSVASITFFVFYKGLQPFFAGNAEGTYSLIDFLTGLWGFWTWSYSAKNYDLLSTV